MADRSVNTLEHSTTTPGTQPISPPNSTARTTEERPRAGIIPQGVSSTRRPAITKDGEPYRSKTLNQAAPIDSRTARAPAASATLPLPTSSQRKSSETSPQQNTQPPVAYNQRNALVGADLRAEPLEQNDYPWLMPPGSSMPTADYRQSGSSFQTEPSSYYSVDDNFSSGPSPPMPDPQIPQLQTRYESLWRATRAPPMPIPNIAPPSIPIPYKEEESPSAYTETVDDKNGSPDALYSQDEHGAASRDRYDSSWLAAPSPGMPVPQIASPSMSVPISPTKPGGARAPNYSYRESHRNEFGDDASLDTSIPSTAPLRIHHQQRPTGGTSVSMSPSTPASIPQVQAAVASSNFDDLGNASEIHASNLSSQTRPSNVRPTAAQRIESNTPIIGTAKPQPEHPTATHMRPTGSVSSNTPPRPTASSQNPSRFDSVGHTQSRPPALIGSNAHSQPKPSATATFYNTQPQPPKPSATDTFYNTHAQPKPSAMPTPSNPLPKPTSTHAQPTATRVDSTVQGNISSRPHNYGASSVPSSRIENKPTEYTASPTLTANSHKPALVQNQKPQGQSAATAHQPTPVHNQSISRIDSKPSARPPGVAPSGFSTSIAPKPSTPQVHQTPAQTIQQRPTISETSHPHPVSSPEPQNQPSTFNSKLHAKEEVAAHANAKLDSVPTRPRLHGNISQMDTQYVNMMLALDDIPALHNILAGFFSWILLAGFILFPGTFTSLQNIGPQAPALAQELINSVTQLPLFIVAWVCCGIGVAGMLWLWWRWRKNYIWAVNKIFLPGTMNSLAGLLSTLANIYGAQHGQYSTTSKSTLIVTGVSTAICGALFLFYSFWLVRRVKARHDREVGKQRAGKYGEGVVDLSKRKP